MFDKTLEQINGLPTAPPFTTRLLRIDTDAPGWLEDGLPENAFVGKGMTSLSAVVDAWQQAKKWLAGQGVYTENYSVQLPHITFAAGNPVTMVLWIYLTNTPKGV